MKRRKFMQTRLRERRALRRTAWAALAYAIFAGIGGVPAWAHHSIAMYDRSKPIALSGTVEQFQWTNPHVWIEMKVERSNGSSRNWGIECTGIDSLSRLGWSRTTLKRGDQVTLLMFPLKDGEHGGWLIRLTRINGIARQLAAQPGRRPPISSGSPPVNVPKDTG